MAKSLPIAIDVTPGSGPVLTSVSVLPYVVYVPVGGTTQFNSTLTCSPSPCPAGASYAWNLSDPSTGALAPQSNGTALFTAGGTPGVSLVYLNVTLQGITLEAAPVSQVSVIYPQLFSVSVRPTQASIAPGQWVNLYSTVSCAPVHCPSYLRYAWTESGDEGYLPNFTSPETTFYSTIHQGMAVVDLNVTLGNQSMQATPVDISVEGASIIPPTPVYETGAFWALVGIGVAIVVAIVLLVRRQRRRKETPPPPGSTDSQYSFPPPGP